jgi:hypothetical protein
MNSSQDRLDYAQQSFEAPLELTGMVVQPEHIDANGHMNVGFYNVIFDQALDRFFTPFDLDWNYVQRTNLSTFVLETHVCYLQEVLEGDRLRFTAARLPPTRTSAPKQWGFSKSGTSRVHETVDGWTTM